MAAGARWREAPGMRTRATVATKVGVLAAHFAFFAFLAPPRLARGAPTGADRTTPDAGRPNVVFILADDLGYGDLGVYGARDIRTPALDRLARAGVRFTHGYSNGPVCTPTRAAFITGRYQQRVGLEWATGAGQTEPGLPVSETSVARLLKDAGYATALVGKWHLGYKPSFGPRAHGFDEFFGILSGNVDHYSHEEVNGAPDLLDGETQVTRTGYSTDLLTERALAFLGKQKAGAPFFLYLAYNAPHWPFQAPDRPDDVRTRETWAKGSRADYAAMVERIDQGVGRVLAALDRLGVAKDTLVVFSSDNGGERLSRNTPHFHRKATLWEGGIRVPFIWCWPARLRPGTSAVPIATMDLTATILAAAAVTPPRPLDGVDLLPVLGGKAPAPERALFWRITREDRKQRAVRFGRWKYLRDGALDLLYDLEGEAERVDVAHLHLPVLEDLKRRFAAWEKDVDAVKPAFVVR
jgi:arylsulfatase A-like enzyme